MLHHPRQAPDQPSAQVGKKIWELKVSDAFIFRGNQQFWLPSLWVHLRAASAELACRGCSHLLFWKSRPLEAFQVGKKGVGCSALAEKCSPGTQPCVVPRGSPGCSWQHPPETEGCQAPQAVMGHSSCVAALPASPVDAFRVGMGCNGWLQGGTRCREGREGAEQLLAAFPPAVCCRKHPERSQVPPAPTPFRPGVCLVERVKGESRRVPVVLPTVSNFLILLSQALPNPLSQDLQTEAGGHQAIPFMEPAASLWTQVLPLT